MIAVATACLLSACSGPREYFALGTPTDAAPGAMHIKAREGSAPALTLDARTPVAMHERGTIQPATLDAAALRDKFKAALSAHPQAASRFTLYFVEGSDTLSAESHNAIGSILEAIKQRPAPDVVVIGHTDRVGSVSDNDKLSRKRADSIRQQMMLRGIEADNIQSTGRGEREPLIPTTDEVAEPRNRRVEILVR